MENYWVKVVVFDLTLCLLQNPVKDHFIISFSFFFFFAYRKLFKSVDVKNRFDPGVK